MAQMLMPLLDYFSYTACQLALIQKHKSTSRNKAGCPKDPPDVHHSVYLICKSSPAADFPAAV